MTQLALNDIEFIHAFPCRTSCCKGNVSPARSLFVQMSRVGFSRTSNRACPNIWTHSDFMKSETRVYKYTSKASGLSWCCSPKSVFFGAYPAFLGKPGTNPFRLPNSRAYDGFRHGLDMQKEPWVWVNYNDLTATSLEWLVRGTISKIALFQLSELLESTQMSEVFLSLADLVQHKH